METTLKNIKMLVYLFFNHFIQLTSQSVNKYINMSCIIIKSEVLQLLANMFLDMLDLSYLIIEVEWQFLEILYDYFI